MYFFYSFCQDIVLISGIAGSYGNSVFIFCMWNLKYNTNEHICDKEQTHRHREQTVVAGSGEGESLELVGAK